MEMSNYLRENEEWSQLLNNKTALYITGQTCDHEEYSTKNYSYHLKQRLLNLKQIKDLIL